MADFSRDFHVAYDARAGSCAIFFRCFDTPNAVTLYDVGRELFDAEAVLLAARARCLHFHRLWSFSAPDSDIARVNEPVTSVEVHPETADLLRVMKDFSMQEPAFDFTVGPVSFMWKHATAVPEPDEIQAALRHVGADKVAVGAATVEKADPHVQVDVGGAAKGYVADVLAGLLRESGVARADIDLGGNLFMLGDHPDGRPWKVAVRMPQGIDAERVVVQVVDRSVVTSGSYERFVEIDGKRYQHIVDVRTGRPSESDIVSASVVSESSLAADLLATTACLEGSSGFPALCARHPGCSFIAITADGRVLRS